VREEAHAGHRHVTLLLELQAARKWTIDDLEQNARSRSVEHGAQRRRSLIAFATISGTELQSSLNG